MAGKKRRKAGARHGRRAARARTAAGTTPLRQVRPDRDRDASTPRAQSGAGAERATPLQARLEPAGLGAARAGPPPSTTPGARRHEGLLTVLLPGRVFVATGRPVAGLICYALQATLLGWLPAVLWAAHAERRLAQKRRGLAARLRPLTGKVV